MKHRRIILVIFGVFSIFEWSTAFAFDVTDRNQMRTGNKEIVHLVEKRLKPQVRVEQVQQQPFTFATAPVRSWLEQHTMLTSEQIQQQHKVLSTMSQRHIASQDDVIYTSAHGLAVGQRFTIYHPMYVHKDRSTKAALGVETTEMTKVALAVVEELSADIATLRIEAGGTQEVRRGDVIMPLVRQDLEPIIEVKQPLHPSLSEGQIIYLHNAMTIAGRQDVVTIDRGVVQGAEIGQLFDIVESSSDKLELKLSKSDQFPLHRIGQLIIIKVFEQRSYAYILASSQAVRIGYLLKPAV